MIAKWERVGRLGEKVKVLSTNWQWENSYGDINYSLGGIVYNIVITTHGVRWVRDLLGESFCKLYKCPTTVLCNWN